MGYLHLLIFIKVPKGGTLGYCAYHSFRLFTIKRDDFAAPLSRMIYCPLHRIPTRNSPVTGTE